MSCNNKIVFVVSDIDFLFSHRRNLVNSLNEKKYELFVYYAKGSPEIISWFNKNKVVAIKLKGLSVKKDFLNTVVTIFYMIFAMYVKRPVLIHSVALKSILVVSVISSIIPKKIRTIYSVTGIGSLFIDSSKHRFSKRILSLALEYLCRRKNSVFIFQNFDDLKIFDKIFGTISPKKVVIPGSGVELNSFIPKKSFESEIINITFVGRLIADKGIHEFIDAAKIVLPIRDKVKMNIVGDFANDNPTAVSKEYLRVVCEEVGVSYLGYEENIPALLSKTDVVVLPSYREGFPKVLIEAAAAGLPSVTTDVPGCRDAVIDEVTGLITPVRDSVSLASSILRLVDDVKLRQKLGNSARSYAEKNFGIHQVTNTHAKVYFNE